MHLETNLQYFDFQNLVYLKISEAAWFILKICIAIDQIQHCLALRDKFNAKQDKGAFA